MTVKEKNDFVMMNSFGTPSDHAWPPRTCYSDCSEYYVSRSKVTKHAIAPNFGCLYSLTSFVRKILNTDCSNIKMFTWTIFCVKMIYIGKQGPVDVQKWVKFNQGLCEL